jgi:RNA polymerase sigma factor for flagellar operon FliA
MLAQGEESAAHLAQPYRAVELDQTRVQLASLVGQLPPAEQRIIRMHYQQGHPFDDIAAELHVTKGRVSQVHKRALGMLRNLLARRPDCDRAF